MQKETKFKAPEFENVENLRRLKLEALKFKKHQNLERQKFKTLLIWKFF